MLILQLKEINEKCEELESAKRRLEEESDNLKRLELKAKEKDKETRVLQQIARIRGEQGAVQGIKIDELDTTKKNIANCKEEISKLEHEVYDGLKELNLDIPLTVPQIDSSGKSVLPFDNGPYDQGLGFIASLINASVPLELDDTQLYPDKIVIIGVKDSPQAVERLRVFCDNIGRLARIALQETDPDVEDVADYLRESDYGEIWEAISGKRTVSLAHLYSVLGFSTSKDKKRVRNFFTNVERTLQERFPFRRIQTGTFELTFFGSLVWKRYCDKYSIEARKEETREELPPEASVRKKETKKPESPSLNKYLSDEEVKEALYRQ